MNSIVYSINRVNKISEKSILQNRQKTIYTTRSINNERRQRHSNAKENVLSKTTKNLAA
jgi:hypothetical protein